jgi:hypothetical protein
MRQHVVNHHALRQAQPTATRRGNQQEVVAPGSFPAAAQCRAVWLFVYLERECLLADRAGESLGVIVHGRHVALHIGNTREHAAGTTSAAGNEGQTCDRSQHR